MVSPGTSAPKRQRRPLSLELRAAVWDKTDGACWYCRKTMHPIRDFTVDHVVAFVKGGSDEIENLVPCCSTCNRQKQAREAESFIPGPVGLRSRPGRQATPGQPLRRVRLAEARMAKGLSVVQLAIRTDLSTQTIKRLEAGGAEPSVRTVRRLMEALGVTKEEFVYLEQVGDEQAA